MIPQGWQVGSENRGRALVLGMLLLLMGLGYIGFVLALGDDLSSAEQHFGATPPTDETARQLGVYVDILNIDPVNEALHLRIHLTPSRALRGARDLRLRVDDGYSAQELALRNEHGPPGALETSLEGGRVALYPFDRFRAALAFTAEDEAGASKVPIRLTVWEGIAGWTVRAAEAGRAGDAGEVRVRIDARRNGALAFLALALYGMMVLIAAAALTVGALVFLRVRKLEATLAGFLSGMLFALPAMRYAMPGSPPLGVIGDRLVFLWAELAVGLGLLLFVVAWATQGARQ